MPQPERTKKIIKLLKWLLNIQKTATLAQCVAFIRVEITEMGGTERTARSYVNDCGHFGLIEESRGRFKITPFGQKWLERHSV